MVPSRKTPQRGESCLKKIELVQKLGNTRKDHKHQINLFIKNSMLVVPIVLCIENNLRKMCAFFVIWTCDPVY